MRLINAIRSGFFKTNLVSTIKFNFRMFPWKVALKMPVFLYGNVDFRSLDGHVEFFEDVVVRPGIVKFGMKQWYVATAAPLTTLIINGTIRFSGPIHFLQGSYILVAKNALLEFGTHGTVCGTNVKIMCFEKIQIGNQVGLTWDVQIYDTSFHYIEQENESESIQKLTKPVIIGDRVWVGNNSTITKGAVIPSDSIVASHSLVNKDFSGSGSFPLFAGVPAKIKKIGFQRIRDLKKEKDLDLFFGYDRTHL